MKYIVTFWTKGHALSDNGVAIFCNNNYLLTALRMHDAVCNTSRRECSFKGMFVWWENLWLLWIYWKLMSGLSLVSRIKVWFLRKIKLFLVIMQCMLKSTCSDRTIQNHAVFFICIELKIMLLELPEKDLSSFIKSLLCNPSMAISRLHKVEFIFKWLKNLND